jgi:hypothetical protein
MHEVLHVCLSAGVTHLSFQGYQQLDVGCLDLKLETNRPVLTPFPTHYLHMVTNVVIFIVGQYFEGNLTLQGINVFNQVSLHTCTEYSFQYITIYKL